MHICTTTLLNILSLPSCASRLLTPSQPWVWSVRGAYQTWTHWRTGTGTAPAWHLRTYRLLWDWHRQTASLRLSMEEASKVCWKEMNWSMTGHPTPWLDICTMRMENCCMRHFLSMYRSLTSDGTINCFMFQCDGKHFSLRSLFKSTSYQISVVQHYDQQNSVHCTVACLCNPHPLPLPYPLTLCDLDFVTSLLWLHITSWCPEWSFQGTSGQLSWTALRYSIPGT